MLADLKGGSQISSDNRQGSYRCKFRQCMRRMRTAWNSLSVEADIVHLNKLHVTAYYRRFTSNTYT
jgi:hypothetical protein